VYSMTMMCHIMVIEYTTLGHLVVWGHVDTTAPNQPMPAG
jgi:hypothetical protein